MSARKRLGKATFVQRGYGQVEPNHLSAPRDGRVYAQLPAASTIELLENGQFVKYDYASGVCNFTGAGEWMMVFNEIKIYRDFETDADFAMIADNYNARIYSPGGVGASGISINMAGEATYYNSDEDYATRTDGSTEQTKMPVGTSMVPRVIGTVVGDLYTTNCIIASSLNVNDVLTVVKANGYLSKAGEKYTNDEGTEVTLAAADLDSTGPQFKVVKVYTMPDNQAGVKLQRIA